MYASYSDRSPEDYTTFGYSIAQVLGEKAQDYNWFVRFVLKLWNNSRDVRFWHKADISRLSSDVCVWG